jgi:Holliday junction resolvase RusA-like endonuclease
MNEITIDIEPVPQPRQRTATIGGRARSYIPKCHQIHGYKSVIAARLHDWPCYEKGVPVRLSMVFRFAMPASWSRAKRERMRGRLHAQKPDIDNLLKAVMDAMNGCWGDDCQVATFGQLSKVWADSGSIWIAVEEIRDDD